VFPQDVYEVALGIHILGLPYANNVNNGQDFSNVDCTVIPFPSKLPKDLFGINKSAVHDQIFLDKVINSQACKTRIVPSLTQVSAAITLHSLHYIVENHMGNVFTLDMP